MPNPIIKLGEKDRVLKPAEPARGFASGRDGLSSLARGDGPDKANLPFGHGRKAGSTVNA